MSVDSRVVTLIDMDCFYCQVEENLDPTLTGQPLAVVQYNAWQGGGIIAVNYPARARGVTRHMRGNEAKKKCPDIRLVQVPEVRGKADLTKYRDAGKRVSDVLSTFTTLLERASVDEAYLDITEPVEKLIQTGDFQQLNIETMKNTFVVGSKLEDFLRNSQDNREFAMNDLKLAVGGLLVENIRREVFLQTGYKCSAGIAHNKILAKLVCSLHKPNQQTILPDSAIGEFFQSMPVKKLTGFGGKFGQSLCDDFNINFMGELEQFSMQQLTQKYDDKTAKWLYDMARGINMDPVTTKLLSKSIGTCKNFPGRSALLTADDVQHWLEKLSEEMEERLAKDYRENRRKAKQVVIHFTKEIDRSDVQNSRTCPLLSYSKDKIASTAFDVIKKNCMKNDGSFCVKYLGLSAGHFEDVKNVREITSYFTVSNKNSIEDPEKNVFQEDTLEVEEDPSSLVFYDDKYRIKPETADAKPSFFTNYFTSTVEETTERVEKPQTNQEHLIECDLCKKQISIEAFECHKDYHFALDLHKSQQEELGTSTMVNKAQNPEVTKSSKRRAVKRKSSEASDNKILMSFLIKETDADSATTRKCTECERNIKEDEMRNHMDYHVAKKLHREMNTVVVESKKPPNSILSFYKT